MNASPSLEDRADQGLRRGRSGPRATHVPLDGSLADADAELEQFAAQALRARARIACSHLVMWLAADVVRRRAGLVAENALLRQQLIVAQRKIAGRVPADILDHHFARRVVEAATADPTGSRRTGPALEIGPFRRASRALELQ